MLLIVGEKLQRLRTEEATLAGANATDEEGIGTASAGSAPIDGKTVQVSASHDKSKLPSRQPGPST